MGKRKSFIKFLFPFLAVVPTFSRKASQVQFTYSNPFSVNLSFIAQMPPLNFVSSFYQKAFDECADKKEKAENPFYWVFSFNFCLCYANSANFSYFSKLLPYLVLALACSLFFYSACWIALAYSISCFLDETPSFE